MVCGAGISQTKAVDASLVPDGAVCHSFRNIVVEPILKHSKAG
jgi:hypothetical protein